MTAERQSEAPQDLEKFKGWPNAPFEVVQKGEEPPKYPLPFTRRLKDNWNNVCKLMNWTSDPFLFEVAKNPFGVVKAIQNRIEEKGGRLPKYGVDGKFGPETEEALAKVMRVTEAKEALPPAAAAAPARAPAILEVPAALPEGKEATEAFLREKLKEAIDALPTAQDRLASAGLSLDGQDLQKFTDNAEVMAFQSRAKAFREGIISKEPRLGPLEPILDSVIETVEAEVAKIDLSTINSMKDLMKAVMHLADELDKKLHHFDTALSETVLVEILQNVKMEELLAFAMSAFNELAVVLTNHFGKNKENLERIGELFKKEWMTTPKNTAPTEGLNAPEVKVTVHETHGQIKIPHKGQEVTIDLDNLIITVGSKRARLALPSGVSLESLGIQSNGDVVLRAGMRGVTETHTIPTADLETYLDKIATSTGPTSIDLGSGASLEVV